MNLPLDTIICGDNVTVMQSFPDACIDLTVTSPPYDNLRTYGGHSWDFEGVAQQLWRITKPGGVVVWVVADATVNGSETGTSFRQALRFKEIGFRLHDTMIYAKSNYIPLTHNRYEQQFEYVFIFSKGKPRAFNPLTKENLQAGKIKGGTFRQNQDKAGRRHKDAGVAMKSFRPNIWFYDVGMMNTTCDAFAFNHPAIFPEALAADHIRSWSNEGDIVLDPFSGSGTTAKMARELGRRYIGIEVNPDYVEIANRRLEQQLLPFDTQGESA